MIAIRHSEDRGQADHGWLKAKHSFSFGHYHDPAHMGFRSLRVINEDRIAASSGFGTHPHNDMEIITVVLAGTLAHKDSMDHVQTIGPGEVQHMSAGTGITHSEYNHSNEDEIHLLQIWIAPEQEGLTPSYDQKDFTEQLNSNSLTLLVSKDGQDGSMTINQNVRLYRGVLNGNSEQYSLSDNRHAWIQVLSGSLNVNGHALNAGDAVALSDEPTLNLTSESEADYLLFDLN